MKKKNILLTLGGFATIAAPVITVVSCGKTTKTQNKTYEHLENDVKSISNLMKLTSKEITELELLINSNFTDLSKTVFEKFGFTESNYPTFNADSLVRYKFEDIEKNDGSKAQYTLTIIAYSISDTTKSFELETIISSTNIFVASEDYKTIKSISNIIGTITADNAKSYIELDRIVTSASVNFDQNIKTKLGLTMNLPSIDASVSLKYTLNANSKVEGSKVEYNFVLHISKGTESISKTVKILSSNNYVAQNENKEEVDLVLSQIGTPKALDNKTWQEMFNYETQDDEYLPLTNTILSSVGISGVTIPDNQSGVNAHYSLVKSVEKIYEQIKYTFTIQLSKGTYKTFTDDVTITSTNLVPEYLLYLQTQNAQYMYNKSKEIYSNLSTTEIETYLKTKSSFDSIDELKSGLNINEIDIFKWNTDETNIKFEVDEFFNITYNVYLKETPLYHGRFVLVSSVRTQDEIDVQDVANSYISLFVDKFWFTSISKEDLMNLNGKPQTQLSILTQALGIEVNTNSVNHKETTVEFVVQVPPFSDAPAILAAKITKNNITKSFSLAWLRTKLRFDYSTNSYEYLSPLELYEAIISKAMSKELSKDMLNPWIAPQQTIPFSREIAAKILHPDSLDLIDFTNLNFALLPEISRPGENLSYTFYLRNNTGSVQFRFSIKDEKSEVTNGDLDSLKISTLKKFRTKTTHSIETFTSFANKHSEWTNITDELLKEMYGTDKIDFLFLGGIDYRDVQIKFTLDEDGNQEGWLKPSDNTEYWFQPWFIFEEE